MKGSIGVGLLALMISACGASSPTASYVPESFEAQMALVLQDAPNYDASDAQLAILNRALARGEVTLEDVNEALEATFMCFDESGVSWGRDVIDTSRGFPVPQYHFSGDAQGETHVADYCLAVNSYWVEMMYQVQPVAVEAQEAWYNEHVRPAMVQCLEEHGVVVPDDAGRDWIDPAANDLYHRTAGTVWVDMGDHLEGTFATPELAVDCSARGLGVG